jgi:DNA-binding PadR family transcriptional regulator
MSLKTNVDKNLPLSESTFLIMLSLAPGPKHGYAIMKDVATLSGDRVQLGTGTLYGALKRLLAEDWIERTEDDALSGPNANRPGRPRRYYVLTDWGRGPLEAEVARLKSLVSAASLRAREVRA